MIKGKVHVTRDSCKRGNRVGLQLITFVTGFDPNTIQDLLRVLKERCCQAPGQENTECQACPATQRHGLIMATNTLRRFSCVLSIADSYVVCFMGQALF